MPRPILILDANILIRHALGRRVGALMAAHGSDVSFLAPDTAFMEARRNLPVILAARGGSASASEEAYAAMDTADEVVSLVPASSYEPMRTPALARIGARDPDDWPVLACALLLDCPVWTEDRDFFGTGVATWMTALVGLYFEAAAASKAGH